MQPEAATLAGGFARPVFDAQSAFRKAMMAMAEPGTIHDLSGLAAPPAPLNPAAAALALALCDFETPVWLDAALSSGEEVRAFLRFHTGAPLVSDPAEAAFALIGDPAHMPPFDAFAQGSGDYPDRSATLILQVATLASEPGMVLTGPGIEHERVLHVAPLPPVFWREVERNRARFPRGIDLFFAAGGAIAALPRTTIVKQAEG